MKFGARFLFAVAAALGFPVLPRRDDAPELPDADRARLDAAAARRERRARARIEQAHRARVGAARARLRWLPLFVLAALLGCAPLDGGPLALGPCRCAAGAP